VEHEEGELVKHLRVRLARQLELVEVVRDKQLAELRYGLVEGGHPPVEDAVGEQRVQQPTGGLQRRLLGADGGGGGCRRVGTVFVLVGCGYTARGGGDV
jgi:hypothetical protein